MIVYFDNGTNPFSNEFEKCGYRIVSPYADGMKVKILRRLEGFHFLREHLYNAKKMHPCPNELIIIFDSNVTKAFLEWIRTRFPENRIVFWYWNPVESYTTSISPDEIPEGIEVWSYSPEDCRKFGLKYNTTFYFDSLAYSCEQSEKLQEKKKALFVGRDKGRLKELLQLKQMLKNEEIECEFHIIGNHQSPEYEYETPISYNDIVEMIKHADILVDYYTDEMAGLSLRPMEALFFRKKLITNNQTIKSYDFFKSNNIFVLNDLDRNIGDFLKTEYSEINSNTRNRYLLSNWIGRF